MLVEVENVESKWTAHLRSNFQSRAYFSYCILPQHGCQILGAIFQEDALVSFNIHGACLPACNFDPFGHQRFALVFDTEHLAKSTDAKHPWPDVLLATFVDIDEFDVYDIDPDADCISDDS